MSAPPPDPSLATVAFTREGAVVRVVLQRPQQLNAITPAMLDDLARVCDALEGDPTVKVVVLTGAGRAFCAGADLAVVQARAGDPEGWRAFNETWHRVFDRIEALPQVVVAGVHGLALAGGLELTLVEPDAMSPADVHDDAGARPEILTIHHRATDGAFAIMHSAVTP